MILKKLVFNKKKSFLNRIVVSPMCQYSAKDGSPTDWHYRHLANFFLSGASSVVVESTAINKEGKISKKDLCIETDKQANNFRELLKYLRKINKTPIGIQLSHSGRKGSSEVPWVKTNTPLKKNQAWTTVSSSNLPKDVGWPKPKKLSLQKIVFLKKKFKSAIRNSNKVNFDFLEIHFAHGYLLHQFLSPISNNRKDKYGGSKKNRFRFPLEVAKIARSNWPKNKLLGARITGTDHLKNGIDINESIEFCKNLEQIGFDYVCISSGGIKSKTNIKFKKFFRVNLAKKIKKNTKLKVGITGMTNDFTLVNKYLKKKYFDNIFVGRPFLSNPFFLYKDKYLKKMGFKSIINQYKRSF